MAGLARSFSGSNSDKVQTSSTLSQYATRTIAFWVNMDAIPAATFRAIAQWGDDSPSSDMLDGIVFVDSAGTMRFQYTVGWSTGNGIWQYPVMSTGSWVHVIITYNGSSTTNDPSVYYNDVLQTATAEATPSGSQNTTAGRQCIGNLTDNAAGSIDGAIHGFARWNTVISSGSRASLAAGTAPCDIETGNLVAYWPLDAGQSPEAELVANITGTVTGTSTTTGPSAVTNPRCTDDQGLAGSVSTGGHGAQVPNFQIPL